MKTMNGIVIINKEKGYTSHDIVKKIKKITNSNKVGHTGTLDPNATGVLPLLLGDATKLSKYLINHDKTYEAVLQLGIQTDTADREGNIIQTKPVETTSLIQKKIEEVLQTFIGKRQQIPPMYSAIKVKGKKLYQYARNGEKIEVDPREIEIYEISLTNINISQKQITFSVKCSKGTYIRTLCEEIAQQLGTVGYMLDLKRTTVGDFSIKQSITIKEFEEEINHNHILHFISMEQFLLSLPTINLNSEEEKTRFLNGVFLAQNTQNGTYRIYHEKQFIGTGIVSEGFLKRDIIVSAKEE